MIWIVFTTKLGWIISPSKKVAKSLEASILYNYSQHNIPALQGRANKTEKSQNRAVLCLSRIPCYTCKGHKYSKLSLREDPKAWNQA